MLFNSLHYLIFFPIAVAVYFLLDHKKRKYWLLAASYYFYWVFSISLSLLLVFSTVLDYTASRIIDSSSKELHRRLALIASLAGNLGMLFTFKYLDFINESISAVAGSSLWPVYHLVLPMGISFYTFQTLAYTIDVYRKRIRSEKNIIDVALYVSFFPQLVAGPIMRGSDLLPQFREKHGINIDRILSGLLLIIWGLIVKIFVAGPMGDIVNSVYSTVGSGVYENCSGFALLLATYAFAIQIFCDFSAYTNIAIGSARVMGFRLMENFRAPYLSTSIRDFWRRWHISLSTWLRDYLYISLGGNRISPSRTYINLMITMLIGGLWHGAAWTFVIWGALHGLCLMVERATGIDKRKIADMGIAEKFVRWFVTFHLICLGWVFFRAETVAQAFEILGRILTWQPGLEIAIWPLPVLAGLLAVHWLSLNTGKVPGFMRQPVVVRWALYAGILLCVMALMGGRSPEFIYFQF